jgi:hypothetical protein
MHAAHGRYLCVRVRHLILDMTFHLLRNYAEMSLPLEVRAAVHIYKTLLMKRFHSDDCVNR